MILIWKKWLRKSLKESKAAKEEYEERLKILLLPKDPNDDKNIILEIRGAAGGDEAALFAGDLFSYVPKIRRNTRLAL